MFRINKSAPIFFSTDTQIIQMPSLSIECYIVRVFLQIGQLSLFDLKITRTHAFVIKFLIKLWQKILCCVGHKALANIDWPSNGSRPLSGFESFIIVVCYSPFVNIGRFRIRCRFKFGAMDSIMGSSKQFRGWVSSLSVVSIR